MEMCKREESCIVQQRRHLHEIPKEIAKVGRSTSLARDVCQIVAVFVNHTQQT